MPPSQAGGFVRIEQTAGAALARLALGKRRALGVPLHGAPTAADPVGNRREGPALLMIGPYRLGVRPPPGAPLAGQSYRRGGRLGRGERGRGRLGSCRRPGRSVHRRRSTGLLRLDERQPGGVSPEDVGPRVREMLPQMKPIRHLARRGHPEARRFRVGLGPIPHQHLAPGLRLKPRGDGAGLPVGEHGQGPPPFQIHPEGAVGMTPSQGAIVDAEDPWGSRHGAGGAPAHPHEGVPADREAERLAPPPPSRPTEREADGEAARRQPQGPPRPGRHKAGQALGEEAARALPIGAGERAGAKLPGDGRATPWTIGARPGVVTVNLPGRSIAPRAAGCRVSRGAEEGDLGVRVVAVPGLTVASDGCRH
jgi:hypothetical protein